MSNLFDVYSLWPIEPVKAEGCKVWDNDGQEYLDLYGGHAVISIGRHGRSRASRDPACGLIFVFGSR